MQNRSRGRECGIEINRPESGGARALLHIGLRRSSPHLKRSQELALKLHFKANDFNQSSHFNLELAAKSLERLRKTQMTDFHLPTPAFLIQKVPLGGLRICISNKVFSKNSLAGLRTTHRESLSLSGGLETLCGDSEGTKSCLASGQISPCLTSLIDKRETMSSLTVWNKDQ